MCVVQQPPTDHTKENERQREREKKKGENDEKEEGTDRASEDEMGRQ